jgi:hypothetical protein
VGGRERERKDLICIIIRLLLILYALVSRNKEKERVYVCCLVSPVAREGHLGVGSVRERDLSFRGPNSVSTCKVNVSSVD